MVCTETWIVYTIAAIPLLTVAVVLWMDWKA